MKKKYSFSVVDFLVGIAVLMILVAMFVPHFIHPTSRMKAAATAQQIAPAPPGR